MPSAWQLQGRTEYAPGDPSALQNLVLNSDIPKPTEIPPGHALVRIRAAALNYRDYLVIAHSKAYPIIHKENLVPCADGAGEIEATGEGSRFKKGDRVVLQTTSWSKWNYNDGLDRPSGAALEGTGSGDAEGTLREYAVIPDTHLISAPSHLSYPELAALPAAGASAWHALVRGPRALKPGQTVLAQGTGGVSCFVIQIAAAIGATVIATSSSEDKLQQARSFGATHTINYHAHPNWEDEVLQLTGGKGVDVVVEVAGSSTISQSLKSTKVGGLVVLVGFMSASKQQDLVPQILFGGYTIYGLLMYTQEMTEEVVRFYGEKRLSPIVGKVFEWEDVKEAFEAMRKQGVVGKIVVKVGREE